jgi:hypothetical protein
MRYLMAFVLLTCSIAPAQTPATQPTLEQLMSQDRPATPATQAAASAPDIFDKISAEQELQRLTTQDRAVTPIPSTAVTTALGNGRFQLIEAEVTSANIRSDGNSAIVTDKKLFKIDTLTGESWYFFSAARDGKLTEGWYPVGELSPKQ